MKRELPPRRFAWAARWRAALLWVALALATSHSSSGVELVRLPPQPADVPWPTVEWPQHPPPGTEINARLTSALDAAFRPVGRAGVPDTRALLVVHRGAIVAERYAPGFDTGSRFPSWSMAKSITQALVAILVRQGRLTLDAPAAVSDWAAPDPRQVITLGHLLHMTSGLDNADDLSDIRRSLVANMMYGPAAADMPAYAAEVALIHDPGNHWAYSTATSMIVAGIVGHVVGGGREGMLRFIHAELLDPLGMTTAVPEFDAAGNFMGGAFFHASARDYARFGLLYLRDGMWDSQRLLPVGWVDYTRTPAPAPNNGSYGAHFWLNLEPGTGPNQFQVLPGGPPSTFGATGNDGQLIVIVPTHDLVLVRLGEMHTTTWPEVHAVLAEIANTFPAAP